MSELNIALLVLGISGTILSYVTKNKAMAWTTLGSIIGIIVFGYDI